MDFATCQRQPPFACTPHRVIYHTLLPAIVGRDPRENLGPALETSGFAVKFYVVGRGFGEAEGSGSWMAISRFQAGKLQLRRPRAWQSRALSTSEGRFQVLHEIFETQAD